MNLETFLKVLNIPLDTPVDDILNMLIIYLRKSRKDMDYYKEESIEKTLERHEKELQDFITRLLGKPIPEQNIFREVASGDTIEDRPVIQEVLSIIEKEDKKGVICIEIERLARGNTIDQGIIAQSFLYTKTKIITPFKIYDLDNEDDLSYFEDGLYQSRKYLKYVKKIMGRGRERSVKDGKYIGSVLPYGYNKTKIPNDKGYILVENESEATIVRLMAKLFLEGLKTTYTVENGDTISSIAKTFGLTKPEIITNNLDLKVGIDIKLTIESESCKYTICEDDTLEKISKIYNIEIKDVHIPNDFFKPGEVLKIINDDMRVTNIANYLNFLKVVPRKSKEWSANMVRNILKSYAIYGYLTWDRRKTSTCLVNGKIKKSNPNNADFTLVKGKHTPILSEETGMLIKERFLQNKNKTVPDNKVIKNPLVGLVSCGVCGNNMVRRPYTSKKQENNKRQKRIYDFDKEKLRLVLRKHRDQSGVSLNSIAKELSLSKYIIDHWFAAQGKYFLVPRSENWNDLKRILNITTDEFDAAITSFKYKKILPHEDTLLCSRSHCICVGSNLSLIEKRILESLKNIKKEYQIYLNDYEERVKKEAEDNSSLIKILDKELTKANQQKEKACELVETGAYSQSLFIQRINTLDDQIENLLKQKKELSSNKDNIKNFKSRQKAIPIIENILNNYTDDMTAAEKNELLSSVIKKVVYIKLQGGKNLKDSFKLDIILNFFD